MQVIFEKVRNALKKNKKKKIRKLDFERIKNLKELSIKQK